MKAKRSVGGRLVVITVFWVLIVYAAVILFGSMLKDLYGDVPSDATARPMRDWCIGRLAALKADLETRAVLELQNSHPSPERIARWERWVTHWQGEEEQAERRCARYNDAAIDTGFDQLRALHRGYATALESLSEARLNAGTALDQTLTRLGRSAAVF